MKKVINAGMAGAVLANSLYAAVPDSKQVSGLEDFLTNGKIETIAVNVVSNDTKEKIDEVLKRNGISMYSPSDENFLTKPVEDIKEENNIKISPYFVGEKVSEVSSSGVGLKIISDDFKAKIEKGDKHALATFAGKFNIDDRNYVKAGLGLLDREIKIPNSNDTVDARQFSYGLAYGYGNDSNFNAEIGRVYSKLSGLRSANTTSHISYIELAGRTDMTDYGKFGLIGSAERATVYGDNFDKYTAEASWYPTINNEISAKTSSSDFNKGDYTINLGYTYKFNFDNFSNGKSSFYINANKNIDEKLNVGYEYRDNIGKETLKLKDRFEDIVGTNSIIAKKYNPNKFNDKVEESFVKGKVELGETKVTSIGETTINLEPASVTAKYETKNLIVKLYTDSNLTNLVGENVNGDFTGLTANTTYYAVTYVDAQIRKNGDFKTYNSKVLEVTTNTVSGPTDISGSTPVVDLSAASDSGPLNFDNKTNSSTQAISWAAIPGATSYEVSSDGTNWTDIGNNTTYTFTGLSDGTYNLSVRAKNTGFNSQVGSLSVEIDRTGIDNGSFETTVDTKYTTYGSVTINGTEDDFTGANLTSVSFANGTTFDSYNIVAGKLVLNNVETNVPHPINGDTITITGTDVYGNPINISTSVMFTNNANSEPVISNIRSTGSISLGDNITGLGVDISDDRLANVTWTLSYTGPNTGSFSTTSGTGDTLNGVTFTPDSYGSSGWTIKATITDSGTGNSQEVTLYSN